MTSTFTSPRWVRWCTAGLAVAFALTGAALGVTLGWSLLALAPLGIAAVSLAVWVQTGLAKVQLQAGQLVFTRRYRARCIPAREIEDVELRQGLPPALLLRSGQRVYLPEVGRNADELRQAIRDWLDQQPRPAARD